MFCEKPLVKLKRLLETYLAYASAGFESFRTLRHKLRIPEVIRAALGPEPRGELSSTNHHESHAASAFFPSPFELRAGGGADSRRVWRMGVQGPSAPGRGTGRLRPGTTGRCVRRGQVMRRRPRAVLVTVSARGAFQALTL
jgi:hypothetical protein